MIEVNDISKSYQKGQFAVDHVTVQVRPGEIFGFLGPNGAGKTTTIKLMTGILSPDSGRVLLNGFDLKTDPLKAKAQFALMPDSPEIYGKVRGIDWLHFIASVYAVPDPEVRRQVDELAERFELQTALYQPVGTYSFGMKHKLSLMAGLLHRPPILIFDEPLQGLDPKAAFWLKGVMREHVEQGGTVFFSTHLLDVAERICDRFAIIQKGRLLTIKSMDELRQERPGMALESYFMELTAS